MFYADGSRPAVAGDRPEAGGIARMELQLLTHILVRHRVMVLLIADVIVDVDLDRDGE